MERIRAVLHADEVHRFGLTGKGITAAVLDTGICRHPDFGNRLLFFRDFVNGHHSCYDDASHGSHVCGILAGNGSASYGRYCGIAPGCSLIVLKVLDRFGQGELHAILAGIDWVIRNQNRYKIRILNISAGTTKDIRHHGAELLVAKAEQAWDHGLVVVTAAGNTGPEPMSITSPGNSRKVITVGSSDQFPYPPSSGPQNYSGCGPTADCICKPELALPGTNVVSCSSFWKNGSYYTAKSGTSMSVPAISGAAALLLEQEPNLTNVEVKMRMKESAADLGLPKNRQGWGMPDLRRLCRLS